MKRNEFIAVTLMILVTIGTIAVVFSYESCRRRTAEYFFVELIARSPNNGNWYPKELKVPYGKKIKLRIRNIETVSHGFALPDFDTEPSSSEIKAGEVAEVTFSADKRGSFPFMCTVWCSEEHMQMNGELLVE